jgi:pilus assembly protein Flp/PilA
MQVVPKTKPDMKKLSGKKSKAKGGENIMYMPREEGQGLVEYALILVLVAIVVIAILLILGPQIGNVFSRVTNGMGTT